jgi:hypothetical protein
VEKLNVTVQLAEVINQVLLTVNLIGVRVFAKFAKVLAKCQILTTIQRQDNNENNPHTKVWGFYY